MTSQYQPLVAPLSPVLSAMSDGVLKDQKKVLDRERLTMADSPGFDMGRYSIVLNGFHDPVQEMELYHWLVLA